VNKHPWTTAERAKAAALYRSGMTVDEVADAIGRAVSSTYYALRKAGVALETRDANRDKAKNEEATARALKAADALWNAMEGWR
jgi:transposase-like protein